MPHQLLPWRDLRENPRRYDCDADAMVASLSRSRDKDAEMTFDIGELWKHLMFGVITGGVTGVAFGLSECSERTTA